jgi:predicted phage baseplate assembly protein
MNTRFDMANDTCDCCEGTRRLTPASVANRPGLSALAYRVGTHARFLETMKARLSSLVVEVGDPADPARSASTVPLRGLTTRDSSDPAIALLDGWATVADVLTFYQERIANEGYLRTATERRSILELARLVGYALRPGVSASVFLAYTIDTNFKGPVALPIGTRSQSVPGPGEQPQSFETSEVLDARAAWNVLQPRLSQPQLFETIKKSSSLYLKGISTNLRPNDRLLLVMPENITDLVQVNDVQPDPKNNRTLVNLKAVTTKLAHPAGGDGLLKVIEGLLIPASVPPANALRLSRKVTDSFADGADTPVQIVNALRPDFREALSTALANVPVTPANPLEVHAFRVKAGVYGSNAPLKSITDEKGREIGKQEWPLDGTQTVGVALNLGDEARAPISPRAATISVANADERLTLDVNLERDGRDGRVTKKLGGVTFTFDAAPSDEAHFSLEEFHLSYGETGNTRLTYRPKKTDNSIDVTISATGQQERKINIAFGLAAIATIQSHNWKIEYSTDESGINVLSVTDEAPLSPESKNHIALDGIYDQITPSSWFVVQRPGKPDKDKQEIIVGKLENKERAGVQTVAKTDYNFPAKVTELTLDQAWLDKSDLLLSDIRSTTVFAQSEKLELAEEPITDEICGGRDGQTVEIELDGLYTDLKSGRWLIVAGDRADIKDANENIVDGLKSAELVMLAGVRHGHRENLPDDKTHTFITLARELAYCYQRDKATIYGNVVKATHGETRNEVLGSGDGSKVLQSFDLKQPPLTYVAAPNPSGVDSTLRVYVNDVEWHAADTLAGLAPTDHNFTTRTSDEGKPTVIFGNGQQGSRLPTGMANVHAVYRNGIGKGGNVQAGQINLLTTRPLGVTAVVNPLRASGGADKESRDQARQNAPLAVMALDRLVSVQDYADFARIFGGIGKAAAVRLSDGRRELVHVTIAGADDIPIEPTSDLYSNLVAALRRNGDPYQPFQVALRELLLLVISANIRILPGYEWDKVVTRASDGLLDAFGFEQRDLGQDVRLNDITSIIQSVPGVAYVDVDLLATIPEKKADADGKTRRLVTPKEITDEITKLLEERKGEQKEPDIRKKHPQPRITVGPAASDGGTLRPARLAILSRAVPSTLTLNQIG